jgi:hypothetical protein
MIVKTSSRAVVYHYFEANQTYRDNLIFFLECGWLDDVDYYLVCSSACSFEFPQRANLHIIKAPNLNLDYGGYCYAVGRCGDVLGEYNTIAFVNCSVRGPFLPRYLAKSWYDVFTEMLDDQVHLIGSSHNFFPGDDHYSDFVSKKFDKPGPFAHLQTTAYAMTRAAFLALKEAGFYEQFTEQPKRDIIADYEIGMTDFITAKGWRINSILPCITLDDPDLAGSFPNFAAKSGDVLFPGAYFGRTVTPEEVIFIKTNRHLLSESQLLSLTFSHLARRLNQGGKMWQEAKNLLEETYRLAKEKHESMIARELGLLNRLRRRLIRLLDANR